MITFANNAYAAFMGVSVDQVIGSQLSYFVPAENLQLVIDHLKSLKPLKPIATHEHTNIAFDGSERWIKWTNRALFNNDGEIIEYLCIGEDILARVGGDEFAVILTKTSDEGAEKIAARMREILEEYNRHHSDLPLGLSIGLAVALDAEKSLHEVFRHADDLMYRDKLYRSTRARNKSIQTLLAALDERDYITQGHAQRLEYLCRKLGEKVKLSSSQLANLALLAQVHDLGKVGIPDSILFKAGPLTAEEWAVMRLHPEKGYRIAITSSDLSEVADLMLKHHEKWDGSGYPIQLQGEDIPIECRILAVVDAYDAMINDRPYSKGRSKEEALEEIKRSSGTHFDPQMVDIFFAVV